MGNYERNVTLLCPTCGGTQFEFDDDLCRCASCNRELTRDELLRENAEHIQLHATEMGKDAMDDAVKAMRGALRKAFKGSGTIEFDG